MCVRVHGRQPGKRIGRRGGCRCARRLSAHAHLDYLGRRLGVCRDTRNVLGGVSGKGIRERTYGLHRNRRRTCLHRLSALFLRQMRLLAQRRHFEPRAGRHHQKFKRTPVERSFSSAVTVQQRRNFILE